MKTRFSNRPLSASWLLPGVFLLLAGCEPATSPTPPDGRPTDPLVEKAPSASPSIAAFPEQLELLQKANEYFQRVPGRRTYIQVDKPLYRPGETIWVRTVDLQVRDFSGAAGERAALYELVSPKGAVVLRKQVQQADGYAYNDFELPAGIEGGEYKIRVTPLGSEAEERPVIISTYQPPVLKKKLEFVRKAYGPGDEVSATVEVKRGTEEPLANRTLRALVMLDGEALPPVSFETNAKGNGVVLFSLPGTIERGDGLLTVLVDDGGITESVSKSIPIVLDKLQFSLFPEGGDLVTGVSSRVYFAARNMLDKPADVEGRVIDDHGQTVARFASVHDGQGRLEFTPATGRAYFAEITRPANIAERYQMPAPLEQGCVLRCYDDPHSNLEALRVGVTCNVEKSVIVSAWVREREWASASADVKPGNTATLYLKPGDPARARAQGVVRVTVFDKKLEPLAERLVYRNWGKDLKVKVKADKEAYSPRDKVTLAVETLDLNGEPVPAALAMSVVDDTVISYADDKTAHMLAHLYLEREIPSKLEEPNFYFKEQQPERAEPTVALDMLLGTQGWRKFEWQKVFAPPPMPVAAGGEGVPEEALQRLRALGYMDDGAEAVQKLDAAPLGRNEALRGMGAPRRAGREKAAAVHAFAPKKGDGGGNGDEAEGVFGAGKEQAPGMEAPAAAFEADAPAAPPDEVATVADIPAAQPVNAGPRPAEAQAAKPRPAPEPPADMAKPAGSRVAPGLAARKQRIAADALDAGDMDREIGGVVEDKALRQDLNKDMDARAMGIIGQREAKRQVDERWVKARVFPAPTYGSSYDGPRTDFRQTIYWAPEVKTGPDGKATVTFYLSDAVTSFRVFTEGISEQGLAGRDETVIASRLPFSMAIKLPSEVTEGDLISLPLTLTNEEQSQLLVTMNERLPNLVEVAGEPLPVSVTLEPASRRSFFLPLRVTGKEGEGEVRFAALANNLKDDFIRTMSVAPLGFPQETGSSGTLRGKGGTTLTLSAPLAGTAHGFVKVYPSSLSTVTSGLAAILRQPSGCFEQASSSNYPNVMVMQMLKENHAATPELVSRTNGFLDSGYRRLTGYESPEKGYEWFGGNPGHEALTAYGLMQFADMKQVYAGVEPAMLTRTADWLMSRRDGQGGFQRNSRALDSFGAASPEITNAYIVFALSEVGRTDIQTELDAVDALGRGSQDAYLVALAANALLNAKRSSAGKTMLEKLVGMQQGDGSWNGSSHSITRSTGHNLTIETTALAVLASLKGGAFDQARRGVDWLMKNRGGYGGFGTTQATVLALRSLVSYTEAMKSNMEGGTIVLTVNGQEVGRHTLEGTEEDAITLGDFGQLLTAGDNQITLAMDGGGSMPFSAYASWRAEEPASSPEAQVALETSLAKSQVKMGESVRLTAKISSRSSEGLPMTIARVGIPGGLNFQTWQLKELRDKKLIDFYETNAREVILYWRALEPSATKEVPIDLVAEVPGEYTGPASSTYLYYTDEYKSWASPVKVAVAP